MKDVYTDYCYKENRFLFALKDSSINSITNDLRNAIANESIKQKFQYNNFKEIYVFHHFYNKINHVILILSGKNLSHDPDYIFLMFSDKKALEKYRWTLLENLIMMKKLEE